MKVWRRWNELQEAYEYIICWRNYVPSLKTKAENENTKKDEEKRKNDIGG